MASSGVAVSYGSFIPSFLRNLNSVPPTVQEGSLFSTPSPAFIVCRFFDDGHSDWCEVMSRNSFDLHLSNSEHCGASVHVFISHLYVYFGEMSV